MQWYFSNVNDYGNGNNWPGVNGDGNGNDAHLRNGNNIKTEIMTSKTYRNGNVCNENEKKTHMMCSCNEIERITLGKTWS